VKKRNCWEVMKCGRQFGGERVEVDGLCPAGSPNEYDGVNGGQYAGRFCWAIAGTLCKGKPSCAYALKIQDCSHCEFFREIVKEHAFDFALTQEDAKALMQHS
jgi:hypothetical protein